MLTLVRSIKEIQSNILPKKVRKVPDRPERVYALHSHFSRKKMKKANHKINPTNFNTVYHNDHEA